MSDAPTYTPTTDTEMQGLSKKELKELASGRASKRKQRAQAELDRRQANKAFKAAKREARAQA